MQTLFRIEMLGRFALWQGNRQITHFRTQKTASLLAYLALFRARSHPRESLIEQFWPDSPLEAARTNVRVALTALRRQLEPQGIPAGAVLMADHAQVRLNPVAFTSDVDDFEILLQEAQQANDAQKRREFYRSAIDLYAGDLLPAQEEAWALSERDRLREACLMALRQLIKELAESRQLEPALVYAHRLLQADPLREESYRHLMRLYAGLGRAGEGLACYQELERLLQKELQTAPSSATRELAEQLRQMAPKQGKPAEVRIASLQSKHTSIKSPATASAAKHARIRIPLQFTRFFGREEIINRIVNMLSVPQNASESGKATPSASRWRLVTLTGLGGTGKTRLSIETAGRVEDAFTGGIWFVPLAEVNDPLLIGEVIRDALDLPLQTQSPAMEQVIGYLDGLQQPALLILDNFEQIAAGGASVVWTLLQRVPSLNCLVTSRLPLSLPGEKEVAVSPLPTPSPDATVPDPSLRTAHLMTFPSVALFVDRAQTSRPDFQITPRNALSIAAICARLEGLPLAIELAAARIKTLTPAQIEERLAERFELLASRKTDKAERHRSLWAAIEWSYHLLSLDLQRFFARLSVFHGGWSLEAAEEICEEPSALDYLTQLRAHSLILAEESEEAIRFRMLETIREFAAEQLGEEERAETQQRHAAYFHHRVTGEPANRSGDTAWLERCEEDLDNLRAVLAWSLQEGKDFTIGFQMADRLLALWQGRGHLSEGRRWYARFLERAEEILPEWQCRLLNGAGTLAMLQGEFQAAQPQFERCLEIAQALESQELMAKACNQLGSVITYQGDYAQARSYLEQYLALARALGNRLYIAGALGNLATVAWGSEDYAASRTLQEQSLQIWREEGDRRGEAITLHNLGNLAHQEGSLAEARAYFEQSLEIARELADPYRMSFELCAVAGAALDQKDYAAAAACGRESLALAREIDARTHCVNILRLYTDLAEELGELELAARMYGVIEKVREVMHFPFPPAERAFFDEGQRVLTEALGAAAFEAAKAEGRALSLEQALACLEEILASKGL